MENDFELLIYTRKRPHSEENISTHENGQFLWFMVVINSVLRMNDEIEGEGKKALFQEFRKYAKQKNNHLQLKQIDQLEQTYDPTEAIQYYSTEPLYYAALNEALRIVDLDLILNYRILIQDIHKQLTNLYIQSKKEMNELSILKVYRGHSMSQQQIKQLECAQYQPEALVHMKSFISTSTNYDTARFYRESKYDPNNPNQALVIFEFILDQQLMTRPFASIKQYSAHPDEDEILIDIGAVFRVDKVIKEQGESNWRVSLTLMNDKDYNLHDLLNHLTNTKVSDNPRNQLMDFAHLLEEMGEYAKAEQLYRHLLIEYKGDTRAESACHQGLSVIAQRMNRHEKAIEHGCRSLELQELTEPKTPLQLLELAKAYNNLGMAEGSNGQLVEALIYLHTSNNIKLHIFGDPENEFMADTYANIGNCYFELDKLQLAEENFERSITIRKKYQTPENHPDFVQTLMSLGNVFGKRKQYDKAIIKHQEAIDLARETLPYNHPLLGMCYLNLAGDYKDAKQFANAKDNYLKAIEIYKFTMNEEHFEMQRALFFLNEVEQHL